MGNFRNKTFYGLRAYCFLASLLCELYYPNLKTELTDDKRDSRLVRAS